MMGWNYRIHSLAAAFARSQLERLPSMTRCARPTAATSPGLLRSVPGIRPPEVPPDRTHVYFFYPSWSRRRTSTRGSMSMPSGVRSGPLCTRRAYRWKSGTGSRFRADALPEMRGYGRGCPWSCGHAQPGLRYGPAEYPVASDICTRRLVLGSSTSSFGPPNGIHLMERYAEAFHKVLVEHRGNLVDLARTMSTEG